MLNLSSLETFIWGIINKPSWVVMDLNEFQTRKQKIDVLLKEQGWIVGDKSKVIIEVDTKQSDFTLPNL